ncbi:MAG TPA: hypothetical protein VD994_15315 [Prosthecobacter sp.]|nr:hypothetical protein [Prosthecobacter sp.]
MPDFEELDLGGGFKIRRTYAHLMAHAMMAFARASAGAHHPAPWRAVPGGFTFDVDAEVEMPMEIDGTDLKQDDITQILIGLIRLTVLPQIVAPAVASCSFSLLKDQPEEKVQLLESLPKFFPIFSPYNGAITVDQFEWIKHHLRNAILLLNKHGAVRLGLDALSGVQHIQSSALSIVSLWAALESIFSVDSEISFRVSASIAAYLEPTGEQRLALFSAVKKLYSTRCKAAHAGKACDVNDLLATANLLRRVLVTILESGVIPTKTNMERYLFGADSPPICENADAVKTAS